MLARAALDPGDEVVIPHPAFEPYGTEATLSGATVVRSPLKGYEQDLDDMLARVTPRTKCVVICTPTIRPPPSCAAARSSASSTRSAATRRW